MNSPQKSADARAREGHGAKTSAIRERAILALLSEKNISKAARKSAVNEKTLRRWLSEDQDFISQYATARQATFQAGMGRVQALTARAIETLAELLDAKAYPNVRLGAARTVAELATSQHEAETILRRLDEVETRQRELDARRK